MTGKNLYTHLVPHVIRVRPQKSLTVTIGFNDQVARNQSLASIQFTVEESVGILFVVDLENR